MTEPGDGPIDTTFMADLGDVELADEDINAIRSEITRVIVERLGDALHADPQVYAMYRRRYPKIHLPAGPEDER